MEQVNKFRGWGIYLVVLVVNLVVIATTYFWFKDTTVLIPVVAMSILSGVLCWVLRPVATVAEDLRVDNEGGEQLIQATANLFGNLNQELVGQFGDARKENCQVQQILADAISKLVQSFTELEQESSRQLEVAMKISGNDAATEDEVSFANLFSSIEDVMQKLLNATVENSTESGRVAESTMKARQEFQAVLGMLSEVKKIADQTNLLAINAAVEAARAGAAGRGFAVVAEEVRNLSIRSNRFSEQIDQSLQGIDQSLGYVEKSIAALAKQSGQLVQEEQQNITKVMGDTQEYYEHVDRSAKEISELSANVSRQVGSAVTSMQFQDMSTQIIDTVSKRLVAAEELLGGIVTLFASISDLPNSTKDDLIQCLTSAKDLVQKSHHNPVSQKTMDEGDIELF